MCSRPSRLPRTRPARESTSRCFLIAWRVTGLAALRREIDSGPVAASRRNSLSRVSSPSAANRGAASRTFPGSRTLPVDMTTHVLHLDSPALGVHPERLVAALRGQPVEARLHDLEPRPLGSLLEGELDECRGL